MEARKAHRFVAGNCEQATRNIIGMSGLPPDQCEEICREITRQTVEFQKRQVKGAQEHAKNNAGPDNTGTA